jgi:hypothetical protein
MNRRKHARRHRRDSVLPVGGVPFVSPEGNQEIDSSSMERSTAQSVMRTHEHHPGERYA